MSFVNCSLFEQEVSIEEFKVTSYKKHKNKVHILFRLHALESQLVEFDWKSPILREVIDQWLEHYSPDEIFDLPHLEELDHVTQLTTPLFLCNKRRQ